MNNVKPIGDQAYNADLTMREILQDMQSKPTRGVIVIRLFEDGTQQIDSSYMSHYEKCFLKAFFDSYIMKWFDKMVDL